MDAEKILSTARQNINAKMMAPVAKKAEILKKIGQLEMQAADFTAGAAAKKESAEKLRAQINAALNKGGDPLALSQQVRALEADAADFLIWASKILTEHIPAAHGELSACVNVISETLTAALIEERAPFQEGVANIFSTAQTEDRTWTAFCEQLVGGFGPDVRVSFQARYMPLPIYVDRRFRDSITL